MTHLKYLFDWFRGLEPILLISILLITSISWGFIKIADEVTEGDTLAFDQWIVRSLRQSDELATPIGPPFVQEMGRDATALGGVGALTLITLLIAGYLWIDNKRRMMGFLLFSTSSGLIISLTLKQIIARPRPDIVPHLSIVHTSSFPSGHSMLSAVVYLTLGALVASVVHRTRLKIYVLAVAGLLTTIVGLSRIYLGVHYPTDVLAGWMAGLIWALACWTLAHWLQQRKQVESDDENLTPN